MRRTGSAEGPALLEELLADLSQFVEFINLFKSVERSIHFAGVEGFERDGEHSFQIAMSVLFLNERCRLHLDPLTLVWYALIHDLVEVYAKDTPAFTQRRVQLDLFEDVVSALAAENKKEREHKALRRICKEWGRKFPSMVEHLLAYQRREDEEGRLVYAADKLISVMNVRADKGRSWHEFEVTLEGLRAYKEPRVAQHSTVAMLFAALMDEFKKHPELFFASAKG